MDISRTEILIGTEGVKRLARSRVAIFGLGGVGGHVFEAMVRAGVGTLYLFDYDRVVPSNLNRQLLALESTLGKLKTETAEERAKEINETARIISCHERLTLENIASLVPIDIDYAVDAIDEVAPKVYLLAHCVRNSIPVVSSMGAGKKLDPTGVKTADIADTSYCPLARVVRKELKKYGITKGITCVYSEEQRKNSPGMDQEAGGNGSRSVTGTISYMPGIFGLTAAGIAIEEMLKNQGPDI